MSRRSSPGPAARSGVAGPGGTAVVDPVPVVRMQGVGRNYPGPPDVVALREVELSVFEGEYVSVVGPSGSGKSTLLHLLGLLDQPTAGGYQLDGKDVSTLSERRRTALRGARIGFVFQAFHLLPLRSALENVELGMLYRGLSRRDRAERARECLSRVGLGNRLDFPAHTLSGGECQRVAIARALAGSPSLLLADEPTGNLDSHNAAAVLDLFADLHAEGLTLIVITHDTSVSARAERQVRIVDGRLS